jgi:hypothetical protein
MLQLDMSLNATLQKVVPFTFVEVIRIGRMPLSLVLVIPEDVILALA